MAIVDETELSIMIYHIGYYEDRYRDVRWYSQ